MGWEVQLERRSSADLTVEPDMTAALLHDTVYRRMPQAGPIAWPLGGEERFEHPRAGGGIHPAAGIGHHQHDMDAGLGRWMLAGIMLVQLDYSGFDQQ